MKHVRHSNYDDDDVIAKSIRRNDDSDDDEFGGLTFGSLSAAQKSLSKRKDDYSDSETETTRSTKQEKIRPESTKPESKSRESTRSDKSQGRSDPRDHRHSSRVQRDEKHKEKNRHKHAPTEASSKKPVSRIRKLEVSPKYANNLHTDIRFDAAYGKADLQETRKNYAFLDDYRENEINELKRAINDKKTFNRLSTYEQNEIKDRLQSLKSRLDTLKNRDLEFKVLDDYKKEQMENFRSGKQSTPYFLKRSDQRKLIQKAKFENMRPVQREKVMERKRKRKLGREFRELEFRKQP